MDDNNILNSQQKDTNSSLVVDKDDEMAKTESLHKYSKSDAKEVTDETHEDEESVSKKIKMVSMTEARRKAVG